MKPSEIATHEHLSVLIVEDNPADADLVRIELDSVLGSPFAVSVADRLSGALAALSANPFDLVLLDLGLPDSSGLEALRRVRETAPRSTVVILTGSSDAYMAIQALSEGAQDYLVKGQTGSGIMERSLRYARLRDKFAQRERELAMAHAARAMAERARERALVLADASDVLGQSFDRAEIMNSLAEALVPRFADSCAIDLVQGGQTKLERVVQCPAHPSIEWMRGASARVFREAKACTIGVSGNSDADFWDKKSTLAFNSVILVPLISAAETRGVVTLAVGPTRSFCDQDLCTAMDLGGRMGTAVEKCDLFQAVQTAVGVRDDFLSVAAHELRTPLTALQLQLQGLQRGWKKLEAAEDMARLGGKIDKAALQTKRVCQLVDSLLDVTRIVNGHTDFRPELLDLPMLLVEVVERFELSAAANGCHIQVHCACPVSGEWDRLSIEQVFTNLVSNAIKYAPNTAIELTVIAKRLRR